MTERSESVMSLYICLKVYAMTMSSKSETNKMLRKRTATRLYVHMVLNKLSMEVG